MMIIQPLEVVAATSESVEPSGALIDVPSSSAALPVAETPDLSAANALLFYSSAGFVLHIGTWHEFPFALLPDTRVIVILRNEATKALLKEAVIDGEAYSGDLDKRDIQAHSGVTLQVRL